MHSFLFFERAFIGRDSFDESQVNFFVFDLIHERIVLFWNGAIGGDHPESKVVPIDILTFIGFFLLIFFSFIVLLQLLISLNLGLGNKLPGIFENAL